MAQSLADPDDEKQVGLSFAPATSPPPPAPSGTSPASAHHGYTSRVRERLRHFLHPNGKRIHVALSPEDANQLRRRLEQVHHSSDFDIYISGTPEHLEALRAAQSHHEDRREQLRQQHSEFFDQFANVHGELDALAQELDRVTTHGVALSAHFDRFGYNAHIRSYDDGDSPSASGSSTPTRSLKEKSESPSERGFATPLKLFKTPVVRQYFHKGILWRASSAEEVQSFELFVDLLYVGIIAVNGDATSEDPTGLSLLRFVITFTLSYKIWSDMALFISWFEADDIFQRFSILFLLACLFGFTTNITQAFESTYATLVGFYLAARLFMASWLTLCAYLIPMVRGVLVFHVVIMVIGAAVWIGSIHTNWPSQLAPIWVALFIDVILQTSYVLFVVLVPKISPRSRAWVEKAFEFYPAINIEHRTERTNAFVTVVFGYTVVAILYQSTRNGIDAFLGKAILGLIQCFIFNWLYFEVDGSNLAMHAIRRHKLSAMAWSMSHLPFIMSFVLGGAALSRLVIAHDSPDADFDALTPTYQAKSEGEISPGIRWFYCAGFGIALIVMGLISISHVHKELEGLRLAKKFRLMGRFAVGIILICLPTAEKLNSLDLVATVTGLLAFTLILELWATSSCHDRLIGRATQCRYVGQCGKKDLTALLKGGKTVDLQDLGVDGERDGGATVAP